MKAEGPITHHRSAGAVHRDERRRLLERVTRDGYIDDYAGIRVTKSGRQFRIEAAVVWNVLDADGRSGNISLRIPIVQGERSRS